jgi:hypothetical protein
MPDEQPTLHEMIQAALDAGATYVELEERGGRNPTTGKARISDSQLHRLAKETATRVPTEEQLRGIANAVQLPYEKVRQAAIAQWLPAESEDHSGAASSAVYEDARELEAETALLLGDAAALGEQLHRPPAPKSA